jgi:predicted ABC-class ATPase
MNQLIVYSDIIIRDLSFSMPRGFPTAVLRTLAVRRTFLFHVMAYRGMRGGGYRGRGSGRGRRGGSSSDAYGQRHWQGGASVDRRDIEGLAETLKKIDGSGYKAYNSILGTWQFPGYTFIVDKVQTDPYAPPSLCRIQMPSDVSQYPEWATGTKAQRIACADYITRMFFRAARVGGHDEDAGGEGWHGSKGGSINIEAPVQYILERTSCLMNSDGDLELRFTVSLPACGRTIEGTRCCQILTENLPQIVDKSVPFKNQKQDQVQRHIQCYEDQDSLRSQLISQNLVAFVANGSILPRQSGISDRPMEKGKAIAFQSPPSLETSFTLPYKGVVTGMGIRMGVSVIVGGGFNGKTTLLTALQLGVYNKIPGDGREYVVTNQTAVSIRAEDGRCVTVVNIQPFIDNLPFGLDTTSFSSPDASGSTSQAANIMEAIEAGCQCLLIDEDTSATNFMIRDAKMQMLVAADKEPITPFVSKVRSLYEDNDISTVLVMGGSGDYFHAADVVIMMDAYRPIDVTLRAKEIASEHTQAVLPSLCFEFNTKRIVNAASLDPSMGWKQKVNKVKGKTQFGFQVQFGSEEIDLSYVEQLVERSQTKSIGEALIFIKEKYLDGRRSLAECLVKLLEDLDAYGIDMLCQGRPVGDLSRARVQEIAAALNRYRRLQVKKK